MKKKLFGLLIIAVFTLFSCEKEPLDSPGEIQGKGETPGELLVKEPFKLPVGIELIGEVTGTVNDGSKSEGTKSVNEEVKSDYSLFGSGKYVRLTLNLFNSGDYPRTVFFPKGLVWRCNFGNFQHGLQAQTTWVCLQPKLSRTIYVDLYCINAGIPAPDQTGTYSILGVTSSQTMCNLLNLIGWRKVNYEMVYGVHIGGKGIQDEPTYNEITEKLQLIVHNLTDKGIDITAEDKAFIESIPELSSSEIQQLDVDLQYPEYFNEFVVPDK